MAHRRSEFARVLASLVLLVIVAVACSSDDNTASGSSNSNAGGDATSGTESAPPISGVPGVTDSEIRFAALGTESNNPTGACYLKCFTDGINAYFAYQNSQGGVYGRKLVVSKTVDDELGKHQQKALEISSANDTFGVFSAPLVGTGYEDLNKAGIPVYAYLTDPAKGVLTNLFGSPPPSCVPCTHIEVAFAAKALGATRIAALGYSVGASSDCAKSDKESIDKYSSDIGGAKVVYDNTSLEFGLPNGLAPEVTAMREADVQLIFACMDQNGTKALAEEVKRQGMNDAVVFQTSSFDPTYIKANADAYEGAMVEAVIRPHIASMDGTDRALYEEWMGKTGAQISAEISAHGWVLAHLAVEGLQKAGAPFDRQKVIDATNAITRFTSGGLISPWDVGRQHEIPTEEDPTTHGSQPYCFVMLQVHGGEPALVKPSTPDKPFLCWEQRSPSYADPEPTNFS